MLDRVNLKVKVKAYSLNRLSVWYKIFICLQVVCQWLTQPPIKRVFPRLCSSKDPTVYIFWRVLFYRLEHTRGKPRKEWEDCYKYTDLFVCTLLVLWFLGFDWLLLLKNDCPSFNVEWRLSKLVMVCETKPVSIGRVMEWMVEAIVLGFEILF